MGVDQKRLTPQWVALLNGNMDKNQRSISWCLNFDPDPHGCVCVCVCVKRVLTTNALDKGSPSQILLCIFGSCFAT